MKKILEFLQDYRGYFSSTRLLASVFSCQFIYESHLILKTSPSNYKVFCVSVLAVILILFGKISTENIVAILKNKDDAD